MSDFNIEHQKQAAAVATLESMKYTWLGGVRWKPPIGKTPDFDLLDQNQAKIDALKAEIEAQASQIRKLKRDVHDGDGCISRRDFMINQLQAEIERLKVATAQAVPEGFVLVPVELTYKQAQDIAMAKIAADAYIFGQEHSHTSPEVKSHIKERALTATTIAVQLNYKDVIQAAQESE